MRKFCLTASLFERMRMMNIVTTKYGSVHGLEKDGYSLFLGIPYAKAPIGELRWRRPIEPDRWEGVREAVTYPNRSMQETDRQDPFYGKEFYDEPNRMTLVSEDSLYLNVWTPAVNAEEKLPVEVFIHGGAFMGGFGHEKEFDGQALCARGIILVTINYRLGPMGFLAHPWLSEESEILNGSRISGNYGIWDQIAALRWVRENIEAFGGDSGKITIAGQSAGGMSVQTLISSPLTKGMIAGAIMQSSVGLNYDHRLKDAEAEGEEIVRRTGAKNLEELRSLSYEEIMSAAAPIIQRGFSTMELPFTPVIDGVVLEAGYQELLEKGEIYDIPYLLGSNKEDIGIGKDQDAAEGKIYQGVIHFAEAIRKSGRTAPFVYYFTRRMPGDDAGAFHSAELWYTFGTYQKCWRPLTEGDERLADKMLGYWTNFIKTGDPNGKGLPVWKRLEEGCDPLKLDITLE